MFPITPATFSLFGTLCFLVAVIHGDTLWALFQPSNATGDSPCQCLTGVFADDALLPALRHGRSKFIGIHWRAKKETVYGFFDPWRVKYANCLAIHELPANLFSGNGNGGAGIFPLDALQQRMASDTVAHQSGGGWLSYGFWRRGRANGGVTQPICHVWLIPETTALPRPVWVALKELLEDGTIGGSPVPLQGEDRSYYYPLGVLLWVDPSEREALKAILPPRTVMMFTTVDR